MISPEKNDIDVSKLFNWGKKFGIRGLDGEVIMEAYIRLVGDAELNRSRVYALRESAELRRELKNKKSELYLAFIPEAKGLLKSELIDLIITFSMRDLTRNVVKVLDAPFPKEPDSEAPLEEVEKYQAEVDAYPEKRTEAISEALHSEIEKEKKRLGKVSKADLLVSYERTLVNELCEAEMAKKFRSMCTFFGTYKDDNYKERMFSSIEEFDTLVPEIREQFTSSYLQLEMNMDDLKK